MTCNQCLHRELCNVHGYIDADECGCYKDKSRYIELPCAVGDTVYVVESYKTAVIEYTIAEIRITKSFIQLQFTTGHTFTTFWDGAVDDWFNRHIFLTKEEAEQTLLRKENEGK